MNKKTYKVQQSISGEKSSKLKRYQELVIGSEKISDLIKYELIVTLCSWIPGAIGIFIRSKLYPSLFAHCGSGVVFGCNLVLRHPAKIKIGNNVIIDDNVMLDAKGIANSIEIQSEVFVGRNSILSCKDGSILLKQRSNIGFNCEIFSSNYVEIGEDTLIAAFTYVVGGGNYKLTDLSIPISQQYDFNGKGGVIIDKNVWIGAHCVVLDGVKIGCGSVVAAGAIVSKDIPTMSISAGIPAKVIKSRYEESDSPK